MPIRPDRDARRRRALAALVGVALFSLSAAPPAWAQTRPEPLTSRSQFLAASSGSQEFLVDPGAGKVFVDVRQAATSDTCAVAAPLGAPLSTAAASVETLAVKADMRQVDALGLFADQMAFEPLTAGAYAVSSAQPFIAMVQIEGGGELEFWLEPLGSELVIPHNQAFTAYARLRDGAGLPLSGATLTLKIQQTTKSDGSVPEKPYSGSFTLVESAEAGTFTAAVAALPQQGVYTFSLEGQKDLIKRQLVASLPVVRLPALAPAAGSSSLPLVPVAITDIESAEANASSGPGAIYYYPENLADPLKPVIVYVHGFNSSEHIWFGSNGFTRPSISANYRVAVVGVHPDQSFSTNAALLANALPQIAAHYDVKKVVIVAHSKGGVDSDAALLVNGMTDHARSVITLATPHWGTPLADLADSDWTSWLAEIFGIRNAAQRSMKPGAMAAYRAQVANHPRNNSTYLDFRTICGWKYWAEPGTYYNLSGLYLANHGGGSGNGGNDGVVNYRDAKRPVSTEIFSGRPDSRTGVNHRQIYFRNEYWPHIQAQLLTVSFDNTPSAPTGLTAVLEDSAGFRGVHLAWTDRSRFETAFRVERAVDGGAFGELATLGPGAQALDDTAVAPGHSYAYRVRALIGTQWASADSNTASVSFPVPVPPAPVQLTATVLSPTSVRLDWLDNSSNETGFELARRVAGVGSFVTIATTAANATSFTDNGVQGATSYEYKVRAVNGTTASAYSNIASATTPAAPLAAPSNLAASYDGVARTIRLTWTDNSSTETAFRIQFSYSGSAFGDMSPATVGANVTSYTSGPNPPTGSYQFRVRAENASQSSAWSNIASLVVTNSAPEIRVIQNWDNVEIADGGSFAFPTTPVASLPISRVFRICNDGSVPLNIANPTGLVSGTGFVQIDVAPATPVQPATCSNFRVRFHVASAGSYTGAITVNNDDANENPYNIALSGVATP